ncbi:Vacuolar protein sorting-associated protein 54 [Hypsibius exemplaris]|uniref:Vacuolar protein sorting-associated protein 54 n=1 Tax=Hypsibius exemplaris TaxID=2072580 RepID=A0A1W0WNI3_HYPEX|nr:Vacuolar protein sorting-associated protein 54 [Hypsibius exemplaris]
MSSSKNPFEESSCVSSGGSALVDPRSVSPDHQRENGRNSVGATERQIAFQDGPRTSRPESRTSRPESRTSVVGGSAASRYRSSGTDYELYPDRPKRLFDFYDASVNLPAVLNDPRKPRPTEFLTRTWGDAFVETTIAPSPLLQELSLESFRPYLRCINVREALLKGTKSSSDGSGRSSAKGHKHSCPDDLVEIPSVFFLPSFSLEQPSVFRQTCPPEQTRAALWSARDRLTRFLDTVESEIARHVSIRAEAFFGVVTSHDLLQERMETSLGKVAQLRNSLRTIQDGSVKPAVETVGKVQKRHNLQRIIDKLQTVATVSQTQLTIQMLLSNGDFVGALDLITTTRDVVTSDLSGLTCFRHLPHQLTEMERFIDKMMSMEFRRALSTHLNRAAGDSASSPKMQEEERFAAIVTGLLRQRRFNVVDWFREEALSALLATLKLVLIQTLTEHQIGDVEENGEDDRSLPYYLLKTLISMVWSCYLRWERNARGDCKDVASLSWLEDLKNAELVSLWDALDSVMKGGEEVLGIRMTVLNAQLQKLAFAFVARFHEDRKQKLSLILDSERWTSAEIPVEFQSFVDSVFANQTFLVPLPRMKSEEVMNGQASASNTSLHVSSPKAVVPSLVVNGENYLVVGTVVLLLRMLGEYIALTAKLPLSMNISGDILQKVVELLRLFNTKTCQLVLGTGALQSAGLRSISMKNLVLSSSCLQLVALSIPVVCDDLMKQLSAKQLHLNRNFDSLLRDYDSHVEEIEKKLVQVLDTQLLTHFSRWEAVVPVPSASFRASIASIKRLHDTVCEMLPAANSQRLFRSIFVLFKRRLKQQIGKLNIARDGGPQHDVVTGEIAFFTGELRSLKSFHRIDDNFSDVWER